MEQIKMKKSFSYWLLTLFLFSCTSLSINNQMAGTYKYEEKAGRDFGYICQVVLHEDSTFDYTEDGHMIHLKSSGNWRLLNDSLILTSNKKHGIKSVIEKYNLESDSIVVKVLTEDSFPMAGTVVIINNLNVNENFSNTIVLNKNGVGAFEKQEVMSLAITAIDLGKVFYFTKDHTANYFKFVVMLKESSYRYFESEKWGIKKHRLVRAKDFILKKIK